MSAGGSLPATEYGMRTQNCVLCDSEFSYPYRKGRPRTACSPRCKRRVHTIWIHYRLRVPEYLELWDSQAGRCALRGCRRPLSLHSCHVDHCHSTGRVRGLLCCGCNTKVGGYESALALGVADYLEGGDAHEPV